MWYHKENFSIVEDRIFNRFTNYNQKNKQRAFIPAVKTFWFWKGGEPVLYNTHIIIKSSGWKGPPLVTEFLSHSKAGKHYMSFFKHSHNFFLKVPPVTVSLSTLHSRVPLFLPLAPCFTCLIQAFPVALFLSSFLAAMDTYGLCLPFRWSFRSICLIQATPNMLLLTVARN